MLTGAISAPATEALSACSSPQAEDTPASYATGNEAAFPLVISRSGVTPGFQRVAYWRNGLDTTPLNTINQCFSNELTGTLPGTFGPAPTSVQVTFVNVCDQSVTINWSGFVPTGFGGPFTEPLIAVLPRDLASTSTYLHQTGFRWANFVKIVNDVIADGAGEIDDALHGGFIGNDMNGNPFTSDSLSSSTAPETVVIRDPDVETAALTLAGWSAWQTALATITQQLSVQDTSPAQVDKDTAATNAMNTALNAVTAIPRWRSATYQ